MSDESGSNPTVQQQISLDMLAAMQRMSERQDEILQQARITSDATSRVADEAEDDRRHERNSRSSSANQKRTNVTRQTNMFGKAMTKATIKYNKAARTGLALDAAMKDLGKTAPAVASGVFKSMKNITKSFLSSFGGIGKVVLGTLQATAGVAFDIASGITGTIFAAFTSGFAAIGGIFSTIKSAAGSLLKGLGNIASGIFDIISQVGKMLVNIISSIKDAVIAVVDITIQLAKSAVSIVKGLLSAPYSMIEAALKLGNEIRREIKENIMQSLEDVKESFDLDSIVGQSFVKLNRTLAAARGAFQSESSRYVQLFGFGIQGLMAASKEATENIVSLGAYAEYFSGSMNKNLLYFTTIKRALSLTSDDMRYLAHDSFVTGKAITATYSDLSMTLKDVAKSHGVDLKRLSSGFFELRKDIQNFGHLADQDLAQVTARMRHMGLEAKSATDLFNKFTTFEEAANSAALLSQVFGMNVDALRLIQAEGPDEIAQMFRESMLATGRTYQDLNRHEKALMSQYTGLGDEALRNLMSYQTMGMTVAEIRKKQEEQDPTRQMIKSTKALTTAVRALQKAMAFDSPFQAFFSGLKDSATLGGPLRSVLTMLSGDMVEIRNLGVRLGRSPHFVRFLEGISTILTEIGKIFSDNDFKDMLTDFSLGFIEVTKAILFSPNLFEADSERRTSINRIIFDNYQRIFGENKPATKLIKFGGKLAGYILKGIGLAIPAVFDGLTNIFTAIFGGNVSDLASPISSSFTAGMREAFVVSDNAGLSTELGKMFNRIKTSFLGFTDIFRVEIANALSLKGEGNRTWLGIGRNIALSLIDGIIEIFSGENETISKFASVVGDFISKSIHAAWVKMGSPEGIMQFFTKMREMSQRAALKEEQRRAQKERERIASMSTPEEAIQAASEIKSNTSTIVSSNYRKFREASRNDLRVDAEARNIGVQKLRELQSIQENRSAFKFIDDMQNFLSVASARSVQDFRQKFSEGNLMTDVEILSLREDILKEYRGQFQFTQDFIASYFKEFQTNPLEDIFRVAGKSSYEGELPYKRVDALMEKLYDSRSELGVKYMPIIRFLDTLKSSYGSGFFATELPNLTAINSDAPSLITEESRNRVEKEREAAKQEAENTRVAIEAMTTFLTEVLNRPTTVPMYLNSSKVGEALIPPLFAGPTPLLQQEGGQVSINSNQAAIPNTPR